MNIALYLRSSDLNGDAAGESIDQQRAAAEKWAAELGHTITAEGADPSLSGRVPAAQRPGFKAVLSALESGRADAVLVLRQDRIGRLLTVTEVALNSLWDVGEHVRVYEVYGGEIERDSPDDPMRTALRQMAGVFAQLERGTTVARLRAGKRAHAAKGRYVGGFKGRYGYKLEDKQYVPDPAEQAVIARMRNLQDAGSSLRAIAAALNDDGVESPSGGQWGATSVRLVLQREAAGHE